MRELRHRKWNWSADEQERKGIGQEQRKKGQKDKKDEIVRGRDIGQEKEKNEAMELVKRGKMDAKESFSG